MVAETKLAREAKIDLTALAKNIQHLQNLTAPATIMAVVKAYAYGHGAFEIAQVAFAQGIKNFGVAHIEEAVALRKKGIKATILAWLHAPGADFVLALQNDIEIAVSRVSELEELLLAVVCTKKVAKVHIKVDTGLHRNGVSLFELEQLYKKIFLAQQKKMIFLVGIFSHFAVADEPGNVVNEIALANFRLALDKAKQFSLHFKVRHLANSAAIWSVPAAKFDLVRSGLALYGLSPFAGRTAHSLGLVPVMTLRARVVGLKTVAAGEAVSYGLSYVTSKETTLALVGIGYADGVPRAASNKAEVAIGGRRYRVAGMIAMDQFVVDLGAVETNVCVGDWAVLFGSGLEGELTVRDWAQICGTIDYEIVSRISGRVVRTYVGGEGLL